MRLCDACIHLAELVQIRLCISRPLSCRAHHGERHRAGGGSLRAGIGRGLGLRGLACFGGTPQARDEAGDSLGRVGIALRLNLAPELHGVGAAFPPAADQVWHVRPQHLPGPLGAARSGERGMPQIGIDRGTADAELPSNRGDQGPLGIQRVDRLVAREPRGMTTLLLRLSLRLVSLGTLALPAIHRRDGDRGCR
jgi:hypothetical protein